MKKNTNEIDKNEKRDTIILFSIIAIIAIFLLTLTLKDTVLEKVDFNTRKNAMIKAYNERLILKNKNSKGFISTPNFDIKLDNLKVENNEISFDLLFDKDFSKVTKEEELNVCYGLNILGVDGKLVVYRDSTLLPAIANANKCNIFTKVPTNLKRSINPYSYTYAKENKLDVLPDEKDLTIEKNTLFNKLVKEGNLYKAHASFKLKENVNVDDLKISINEIIVLRANNQIFLYDQTHFTEYELK